MSQRKILFAINEFYHIYNRGNSKQTIFHDRKDYERFLKLLFLSNDSNKFKIQSFKDKNIFETTETQDRLVSIGSYCLMPNHFHILITQTENGSISKFMQKVSTGYSMYYNQKYKRTGTLFEGKFKSVHINNDSYLKYIFSYIHLNPIKIIQNDWKEVGIKNLDGALDYLNKYHYSSYLDFKNNDRVEKIILNKTVFPDYFPTKDVFEKEIINWINYRQDL